MAIKKIKQIGTVTHYFDKIKVAVIKFKEPIKVGDTIKIEGGISTNFKQKIASIQVDHKKVAKTKKNQEAGVKVKEKVHDGYKVYKV